MWKMFVDKYWVIVGEPGYSVVSVKCGKCLLTKTGPWEVRNHDSTCCVLTPSVALGTGVPGWMKGSSYHGTVCVDVKDSIFEPSSPHPHATELVSLCNKAK